nr:zinc finger, CCHC-type [Tanacetum cinerariifolium]
MKSYLDTLERLGFPKPNELGVRLILNSLNKDYEQFVLNYNMHSMGKTFAERHAMLKLTKKGLFKKVDTPIILAIRGGKIRKDKKKPTMSKEVASYFKTLIDDFSGYGYVYLMKHKHEVFETFKVFQNEVENQLDAEEHELGDLNEPPSYKAALLDLEFDKWLDAMNVEMQSMKDNEVWVLVKLPHNGKTVGKVEYIAAMEASIGGLLMRKFIDGLGNVMPTNKTHMEMLRANMPAIASLMIPKL